MAKTTIELGVNVNSDTVEQAEAKTKSLKAQLREMKALLASGTLDEKSFQRLAAEAGELQDRIQDVSNTVRNLASDGKTLDGIVGVTEGIVGGFAAVQGITALVGEENEDLNKTIVKIQSSIALLNGLQAINNTLQQQSAAMLFLTNVQTKALAAGQTFLTLTTMKSVAATYALRAALIASGIGAIVVLVAALAGAFSDVGDEVKLSTEEIAKFNEKLSETSDLMMKDVDRSTEVYKAKLKLNGGTNQELIKQDIEALKQKQQILRDEAQYVKGTAIEKQAAIAKINEKGLELGRQITLKEIEIQQLAKDEADKLREKQAQANEKAKEERKREKDKELEEQKRINAEKERLEKEHQKKIQDIIFEAKRFIAMSLLNERDKEYKDLFDEYQKKLEIVKGNQEAELLLNEEWEIKRQEIQDKYLLIGAQKEKEIKTKQLEDEKTVADQKTKQLEAEQQAKISILNDTYNGINALGETLLGQQYKQTAIGKTLALAQIATDTAIAISSLVKNSEANPTNALTGGISGAVQFASGFARITAAILKAKSVLSGGNASAGGSSSSGGGQVNTLPSRPDAFIPQRETDNGVTRVYVLENDISTAQQRVARIKENATIE